MPLAVSLVLAVVGVGCVVGEDCDVDFSRLDCRGRWAVGRGWLLALGPWLVCPFWLLRSSGVWLLAHGHADA